MSCDHDHLFPPGVDETDLRVNLNRQALWYVHGDGGTLTDLTAPGTFDTTVATPLEIALLITRLRVTADIIERNQPVTKGARP